MPIITYLRLGINVLSNVIQLRLGEFSYDYTIENQEACLRTHKFNFIIDGTNYPSQEVFIDIINNITKRYPTVTYDDCTFTIHANNSNNLDILLDYLNLIIAHLNIHDTIQLDCFEYTSFISSTLTVNLGQTILDIINHVSNHNNHNNHYYYCIVL